MNRNRFIKKKASTNIPFKSSAGNLYFYETQEKTFHLTHPIFFYILKLNQKGEDILQWFHQLGTDDIEIPNFGSVTKQKIEYYVTKFILLKNSGYFNEVDHNSRLRADVSPKQIGEILANVNQITFEVTDACNLRCQYCGYGEFYENYDRRENKNMDIRIAKHLLDSFAKRWNSQWNRSRDKNIYLGFYGGEPLLNFSFISELIAYAKSLKLLYNHFTFSMTTNGLLLNKYMDFLVENKVHLLISLDGDEANNSYRRYADGTAAFHDIMKNITALKTAYPRYFKEYVNFNAVLHNKNSVSGIFHFFKDNFDKSPSIGSLNTTGIDKSRTKDFWETYSNVNESLFNSDDYSSIEKEMFIRLPNIQDISTFLHGCNFFSFKDYNELLFPDKKKQRLPTGTCLPFSKKIFVSVNGKLLPCERIGHQYALGHVYHDRIDLDEEKIAKTFNDYISRMEEQCNQCHLIDICSQCIFHLDLTIEKIKCKGFMNAGQYAEFLSHRIEYLEKKPGLYSKIFKEVIIE